MPKGKGGCHYIQQTFVSCVQDIAPLHLENYQLRVSFGSDDEVITDHYIHM